jgi:hypothetical protein
MFNVAGLLLVLERTGNLTLAGAVVAAGETGVRWPEHDRPPAPPVSTRRRGE